MPAKLNRMMYRVLRPKKTVNIFQSFQCWGKSCLQKAVVSAVALKKAFEAARMTLVTIESRFSTAKSRFLEGTGRFLVHNALMMYFGCMCKNRVTFAHFPYMKQRQNTDIFLKKNLNKIHIIPSLLLLQVLFIFYPFFFVSCSFSYKDLETEKQKQPDMVFSHVTLLRYNDNQQEIRADAGMLEMYDAEKLWIGKTIGFTQYDLKTQKETVKGRMGLMLINESAKEYYLGNDVFCHLIDDDYSVRSSALVWKKEEGMLAAPSEETVRITQGDGLSIEGKNFSANTKTKAFMFKTGTKGTIIIDNEKKPTD